MTMVNPKDDQGYTHWVCSVCGAPGQGWTDCPQCKRNNLLAEQNQMMAQQAKEGARAVRSKYREQELKEWRDEYNARLVTDPQFRLKVIREREENEARRKAEADWISAHPVLHSLKEAGFNLVLVLFVLVCICLPFLPIWLLLN